MPGRSFAPAEKFAAEVAGGKLRAAYVLIGDEVFFRDQCRQALLEHMVPADMRDFSLHDLDLAEVSVAEVLDRARTPSLMAPFQVFFIRGVKNLYGRGSHAEEFAAIEARELTGDAAAAWQHVISTSPGGGLQPAPVGTGCPETAVTRRIKT